MTCLNINGKAGNQSTDVISAAIRSGKLPQIPNALYAVLTDVKSSTTDLCSDGVCAWHFMSNFADGSPYNVVDIPAPAICNCGTGLPDQLSPNRDANVDALVTNLWHEIAEAVTDPDCGGGWYDASSGLSGEIADKCDLYYGPTFVNSTLSYNVDMPWVNRRYFVQGLFDNSRGDCFATTSNYSPPPPYVTPTPSPSFIYTKPTTDCSVVIAAFPSLNLPAKCCGWTSKLGNSIACDQDGSITSLTIVGAGLKGLIPASFSVLYQLQSLNLSGNAFTGTVPSFYQPSLLVLDLSNNQLSGNPTWVATLPNLQFLSLSSNKFNGTLDGWSSITWNLNYLYLDNNQFTGALPAWLSNTPEQSLNLSHNQFSGTIPALLGLNYAQTIDLSYNRLVGPIPDGLSYLVLGRNLRELDIQGNLINGTIPPAFKDVTLNYDKSKLSFAKSNTNSTVPQQCSHDPCTIGGSLDPFCSPCIRNVTAQDAFCGTVYWDVLCVSEVTSICGISCVRISSHEEKLD
ncbi:hypothetical protein HK101_003322 [Irineochytrium annulatum]|nr:hypothetical protein HK101_003322 [Irineochytrium annulatum]